MAQLTELPVALRKTITTLFRAENYCFATHAKNRSPTFHFAEGGAAQLTIAGLCGRIRTQHEEGPLIELSRSARGHYFFRSAWGRDRLARRFDLGLSKEEIDKIAAKFRAVPRAGDYHFEFTKVEGSARPYARLHRSAGQIVLEPRIDTDDQALRAIEKVMAGPCQVKLGGQLVLENLLGAPLAQGLDTASYIAAL